jgi:tRNA threonylcarbamoyladenosine biosynthesis protein TsaB
VDGGLTVLLLAVETATDAAGVALADDEDVLVAIDSGRRRRHAEAVAPAVAFACERAGVTPADLTALVVDVGPGLFTGLRVGLATVKALAMALELPVATATSLEVLAHAVAAAGVAAGTTVVPVVDARRGELFSAVFEVKGGVAVQSGDDWLAAPDALARTVADLDRPCVLVGDGARRYAETFSALRGVELAGAHLAHPPVAALAALGRDRVAAGTVSPEHAVRANYLRQADVRINWETRQLRPEAGT